MKNSRAYMRNAEFKARQLWIDFQDAVGTALEVLEPVKEAAWNWFNEWRKNFRTSKIQAATCMQTVFPFYQGKPTL